MVQIKMNRENSFQFGHSTIHFGQKGFGLKSFLKFQIRHLHAQAVSTHAPASHVIWKQHKPALWIQDNYLYTFPQLCNNHETRQLCNNHRTSNIWTYFSLMQHNGQALIHGWARTHITQTHYYVKNPTQICKSSINKGYDF